MQVIILCRDLARCPLQHVICDTASNTHATEELSPSAFVPEWKSPWGLNMDREHIERSNIFNQTLRLCGGHWGAVQVRDQRLHLSSSSTQTSTLEQQLQHCCCSPADIQGSHYCWASAFDLNPQPRVTVLFLERLLVGHIAAPGEQGQPGTSSQPGTLAEHLWHHYKSLSRLAQRDIAVC